MTVSRKVKKGNSSHLVAVGDSKASLALTELTVLGEVLFTTHVNHVSVSSTTCREFEIFNSHYPTIVNSVEI